MVRYMLTAMAILASIATFITLIAIWTDSDHWAQTAFLFWGLTIVPGIALLVRWMDEGS